VIHHTRGVPATIRRASDWIGLGGAPNPLTCHTIAIVTSPPFSLASLPLSSGLKELGFLVTRRAILDDGVSSPPVSLSSYRVDFDRTTLNSIPFKTADLFVVRSWGFFFALWSPRYVSSFVPNPPLHILKPHTCSFHILSFLPTPSRDMTLIYLVSDFTALFTRFAPSPLWTRRYVQRPGKVIVLYSVLPTPPQSKSACVSPGLWTFVICAFACFWFPGNCPEISTPLSVFSFSLT